MTHSRDSDLAHGTRNGRSTDVIPAIDTEVHTFFRAFPPEAGFDGDRRKLYTWQERSGDLLVAEMQHAGVEKAFLISYDGWDMPYYMSASGAGRESFWGGADYCRVWARKYPEQLLWFVTLRDPRERKGLEPLLRRLDEGARGIKVFPGFLEINIDDPVLLEAYALVHERGGRIIFGFEDTNRPETPSVHEVWEAFAHVAESFPEMPMQTNHLGYLDPRTDEAERMFEIARAHSNIYISSACLQFMWEDGHEYLFASYLERIRALRDGCGADRIVFGSDWPWLEHYFMYPQLIDAVRKHADFLSEEEKHAFLHENARRFLGEQ
jgi:predicted TIM-barrel fold metal-dependent hydrolase